MAISPQITVSIKPDLYQTVLNTDRFNPGSILKLKVLELRGDRALIDFGNFRAIADVKIPVTLGEELLVSVQSSGRQLKLSLLNSEQKKILSTDSPTQPGNRLCAADLNRLQTDLKQILNQVAAPQGFKALPGPFPNVLSALNAHFESLDLRESVSVIFARLKSYVENSGLLFEKLLERVLSRLSEDPAAASSRQLADHPVVQTILTRDLKANLLMFQNLLQDPAALETTFDSAKLATLRSSVDGLLADITGQQGRAVQQMDQPEPFQVFMHALVLEENKQAANLKIYYQKKKRKGVPKGFQISLLLSMDRLGDLRTDFHLMNKDLKVTFFVKDQPIKTRIQENFSDLQELLNPFFNLILLEVMVSEKKIKDFESEDLQTAPDRRVDLRI
jgi:hypothetical protein